MAKPEKMTSLTVFIVLAENGDVSRSPGHSYGETRRIPGFFDLSNVTVTNLPICFYTSRSSF